MGDQSRASLQVTQVVKTVTAALPGYSDSGGQSRDWSLILNPKKWILHQEPESEAKVPSPPNSSLVAPLLFFPLHSSHRGLLVCRLSLVSLILREERRTGTEEEEAVMKS